MVLRFLNSEDNFADHIVDEKIAISEYSLSASVRAWPFVRRLRCEPPHLSLQVACGKVTILSTLYLRSIPD
jgi:hypothetical protein